MELGGLNSRLRAVPQPLLIPLRTYLSPFDLAPIGASVEAAPVIGAPAVGGVLTVMPHSHIG